MATNITDTDATCICGAEFPGFLATRVTSPDRRPPAAVAIIRTRKDWPPMVQDATMETEKDNEACDDVPTTGFGGADGDTVNLVRDELENYALAWTKYHEDICELLNVSRKTDPRPYIRRMVEENFRLQRQLMRIKEAKLCFEP